VSTHATSVLIEGAVVDQFVPVVPGRCPATVMTITVRRRCDSVEALGKDHQPGRDHGENDKGAKASTAASPTRDDGERLSPRLLK
jgi:hypothetical protein